MKHMDIQKELVRFYHDGYNSDLAKFIYTLPTNQQQLLEQRYKSQLRNSEIAKMRNVTAKYVSKMICYILEKITHFMECRQEYVVFDHRKCEVLEGRVFTINELITMDKKIKHYKKCIIEYYLLSMFNGNIHKEFQEIFEQLDSKEQQLLVMNYKQNLSLAEIANKLNSTVYAVDVRKRRIFETLTTKFFGASHIFELYRDPSNHNNLYNSHLE